MQIEATGRVTAVLDDKGARFVVIDHDGTPLAARFYGRAKLEADAIMVGHVVRVSGRLASREYNGRWYTSFEATKCVLTTDKPRPAPPPDDDDVLIR